MEDVTIEALARQNAANVTFMGLKGEADEIAPEQGPKSVWKQMAASGTDTGPSRNGQYLARQRRDLLHRYIVYFSVLGVSFLVLTLAVLGGGLFVALNLNDDHPDDAHRPAD